jgi:transcriptional regulator with XRE-family HTH domain
MTKKNFKDLLSNETSKVHLRIAFLKANKAWLKKSMRIAVAILKVLRERKISQNTLAASLNVTPQYVNKILKGNENLTLETISKIEEILGIKLVSIEPYTIQAETVKSSGISINIDKSKYKQVATDAPAEERNKFNEVEESQNNFSFAA